MLICGYCPYSTSFDEITIHLFHHHAQLPMKYKVFMRPGRKKATWVQSNKVFSHTVTNEDIQLNILKKGVLSPTIP